MDWLPALLTLTLMEVVLGIDNLIFIAILAGKLPVQQQARARSVGLMLAMLMRLGLLFSITWVMSLTQPVFTLRGLGVPESLLTGAGHATAGGAAQSPAGVGAATGAATGAMTGVGINAAINEVSVRDLILFFGGLFLMFKSVKEIHHKLEGAADHAAAAGPVSFRGVILQVILLDLIFSLDSVITAVGMAKQLWVMVAAVVMSVGFMLAFAGAISDFVNRHPTFKVLALSFLILIGVTLMAEGLGTHISKGYIYFAMAFAFAIELINMKVRTAGPAAPAAPTSPTASA